MVKIFIVGVMSLVLGCLPSIADEPILNFAEFDAYVEKAMQDWSVPGAAVAIVKDGQIVHLKTYGVRSLDSKKPVTPETIFPIASLTKGFTAALISRLVEEGKIHWEDRVQKYLPDFKIADEAASTQFTIEDLLSHRSGLPGFATDSLVETGWAAEEIYQSLHKIPLKDAFRTTYNYQNVFPGIAGWIAAKVTGKPLSSLYEDALFTPLHLTHASIGKDGLTGGESFWVRLKKRVAGYFAEKSDQYSQLNGQAIAVPGGNDSLYCFEASRGINMSITDMAKWAIFQLTMGKKDGKTLVSEDNFKRMRTSHIHVGAPQGGRLFPKERVTNIDYGMGWFIHDYNRLQVLGHMGGMTGTRSIIALVPDEQIGIVILSNLGGMRVSLFPEAIRSKFLDLYLKLSDQHDWSQELLVETQAIIDKIAQDRLAYRLKNPKGEREKSTYVGTYQNNLYGTIQVIAEDGRLFLTYRHLKVELIHWNGDNFSFKANHFSKAYPATDRGDLMFYLTAMSAPTAGVLELNLLFEGADKEFHRQPFLPGQK